MVERDRDLHAALDLIRRALDLLDSVGERGAAIHLQRAIDAMTNMPVPRTDEQVAAMLATPEVQELQERLGLIGSDRTIGRQEVEQRGTRNELDRTGVGTDSGTRGPSLRLAAGGAARTFGLRLREERCASRLTQDDLSKKTDLSADYISLIERGRANPTIEAMIALAEAVNSETWKLLAPRA